MGMGASSTLALSTATQGVAGFAGQYAQAGAADAQADFQKSQANTNAVYAEMQGADAIKRGDKEARALKGQGKKLIGSQRAAAAAQGIEVDSGSALDTQEDTAGLVAEDALTIKNNAWREAWGYKVQASNYQGQGAMAGLAAKNTSRSSLVTGGLIAAGKVGEAAYQYKKG
jgi:hypothetical protein